MNASVPFYILYPVTPKQEHFLSPWKYIMCKSSEGTGLSNPLSYALW